MTYMVSRQHYWGAEDPLVVEIASGGLDYAGSDMLSDPGCYGPLGCDQEYDDPRAALRVAFRVRRRWEKKLKESLDIEFAPPRIEFGYTGGYTLPFENYPSPWELRAWANKRWATLPKCPQCQRIMGQESWYHLYDDETKYCSENCSSIAYAALIESSIVEWECPDCEEVNEDSTETTATPICWMCGYEADWAEIDCIEEIDSG